MKKTLIDLFVFDHCTIKEKKIVFTDDDIYPILIGSVKRYIPLTCSNERDRQMNNKEVVKQRKDEMRKMKVVKQMCMINQNGRERKM